MATHKFLRIIDDSRLATFYAGIESFCAEKLVAVDESESSGAKIFADPIEGYATLEDWEVAIVNTQLFQRLRFIKQLGLAYLVYPTLGYGRFEHTLGVRARLDQIVSHLRENLKVRKAEKKLQHLPEEEQLRAARLAALCHDIGHCLFSHVSESVINRLPGSDNYPSAKLIRELYSEYAGKSIPMAEVFAVAIVTSPTFIQFLHSLGLGPITKANELAINAANLIMGLPIPKDPTSLFLGQLMSSGLDADKLDYMMRESHNSGITVGISLGWLLKKLMIFELPASEVPVGIKSRIERHFEGQDRFVVLGLEKGGQFGFEEFCVARLALHEKIYLHQKVRAAEAYLRENLAKLPKIVPEYAEAHRWLYLSESLLEFPNLELPTLPALQDSLLRSMGERNASKLGLDRLFKRHLLYRGYAFGWQNAIAEPLEEGRTKKHSGTDQLMNLIRTKPEKFELKLRENISLIRKALPTETDLKDGVIELVIDPPRISSLQQGHDSLFIERPNQLSLRWTIPIDKIVEYYHDNRALGYVFAAKEHLPLVALAAEKTAWDLFDVVYVQEGFLSKGVIERMKDLKEKLHTARFYETARLLQPIPKRLHNLRSQALIRSLAEDLAVFESRTKRRVTPASTTAFLAQFPDDLQEAALAWLQHIQWIEPEAELAKAFAQLLEQETFRNLKSIAFCPLGAASDSASRLAYNLRELPRQLLPREIRILSLNEALSYKFDGYVFYDDNANTGLQAVNIVAAWLGKKLPAGWLLKEEHGFELPSDLKDELLKKPIGFAYAVASEGAGEKLHEHLSNLTGIDAKKIGFEVSKTLYKDRAIFSGKNSKFQHPKLNELRDFVYNVAKEIVVETEKKSPEEAEIKALGYNNAEAMIVFPYNCPTMTVTALWIRGKRQGVEWIPLIERARRTDPKTGAILGDEA
jgi:HD superfamily phosphohydrolase